MRIRSIKPEFWRSDDITSLPIEDRLLFIGLWSYVDDNGVGVDRLADVCADLFAHDLSVSPHDTLMRVTDGLNRLHSAALIERYKHGSKNYLHIRNWSKHQRINRPSPGRYPLPDGTSEQTPVALTEDSVNPPEIPLSGAGEQWNRGTVEQGKKKTPPAAADDAYSKDFETFWKAYPRKKDKKPAWKAWKAAMKRVTPETAIGAARMYARDCRGTEEKFIKHGATWLNGDAWNDYPQPPMMQTAAGDSIPEWSKQECDEILGGPDYWSCPRPPEGLDLAGEVAWKRERVAEHLNERRQKAWEVIQRDSAA